MNITRQVMDKSVGGQPYGRFEPFVTPNNETAVGAFYDELIGALRALPGLEVERDEEHHGSGYASYISLFLFPADGSSQVETEDYWHTTGLLLYLARLAPLATFGASERTHNKDDDGSAGGFIESSNVGTLPDAEWVTTLEQVEECLAAHGVELLYRAPLVQPAPEDISIPTVFDPPYYVFDTLFYWED